LKCHRIIITLTGVREKSEEEVKIDVRRTNDFSVRG